MEAYRRIRHIYRSSKSDHIWLFQTLLSEANEIGWDAALESLERCVIEKRLAWLDGHLGALDRSGNSLLDGFRIFYQDYLGISIEKDGEVVEATDIRLVTRWWNNCPTLEACKALGLDTRVICKKVYHKPVQVFLSKIDPRLKFDRNYTALRPYAPYCEELITLETMD